MNRVNSRDFYRISREPNRLNKFLTEAWSIASDVDKEKRSEFHLPRPLRHIVEHHIS